MERDVRNTTSTKGIVRPEEVARQIDLRRYPPGPDVGIFVERYWAVHWDRRGCDPYAVRLISQPCVNLTFTADSGGMLHGVATGTSTHPVNGAGRVFGVKFRPGGFAALAGQSAVDLTDRSLPLAAAIGAERQDVEVLTRSVVAADDRESRRLLEEFLTERLPRREDRTYRLVLRMVDVMLHDRTITRVGQVSERFDSSVRTLQRLFRHYLGVGPKWLIRRYRLHDGAERLAVDPDVDPAELAVELGWFDQAHFTRDFTALLGISPMAYANRCRRAGRFVDEDGPIAIPG